MVTVLMIMAVLLAGAGLWFRVNWLAAAGAIVLIVLLILLLVGLVPPAYR